MMKRLTLLLWVAGLFILGLSSLHAQTRGPFLPSAADNRCWQWVDSVLSGLNVHEKVGQLIVATIPARADKATKKQMRELVKKYKVGGLLFSEGTPEEQAILTNMARKDAKIPVMVAFDGERGVSMGAKGASCYLRNAALGCIVDDGQIEAYGREVARQCRELGVCAHLVPETYINANKMAAYGHGLESGGVLPAYRGQGYADSCLALPALRYERVRPELNDVSGTSQATVKALLAGNDIVWALSDAECAVQGLVKAVETGQLGKEELDARCRKVLACKYVLGLRDRQPKLRISGMSYRVHTEEAQTLAAKLRRSAVTVLNNYFNILPLASVEGGIAVLSIGEKEADAPFVEAMKKNAGISHFHLPWNAGEALWQEVQGQLAAFRRVVISITGSVHVGDRDAAFLENLNLRAPLVYAFFTSYHTLLSLQPAIAKSSAVVLAHSAETDLQQYVADVLFAKEPASGRMSVNIGRLFPAGTGCMVEPGMKPGKTVPEDYGMKSYVLQGIDAVARKGLEAGAYPGCRVLVWKDGLPVYDKGFGTHSDKDTTTVRSSDLFDLASLTKTTATLLAVMKLYDEGKIKLDDKVSAYLPFLRNGNKRSITIRELLFHESGLPPYIRFYLDIIDPNSVHGPYSQSWVDEWHRTQVSEHSYYCSDFKFRKGMVAGKNTPVYTLHMADGMWLNKSFRNSILQRIAKCELDGKRYVYSDLGFVLLQQVVEKVTELPMDLYLAREFYAPMGLQRTMFLPLTKFTKAEIMPTASNDFLRRQDICGYVHDETAACMGGVSGNAGLFSTAEEVAKVYQMLLNGGEFNGKRFLSEATCRLFTTEKSAISRRGLGFDKPDVSIVKRSPCAPSAPEAVYGHTGFTGTCAWVDPENKTVYVFLSNRLCPNVWNTKLGDMNIRRDIQELIYKSMIPQIP